MSKPIHSFHEPVIGEAMAALVAVEFCRDLGLQDIVLEGDSMLVVNAIKRQCCQMESLWAHNCGYTNGSSSVQELGCLSCEENGECSCA
jgi:hypothetical protein